jgi:hypothetical protein
MELIRDARRLGAAAASAALTGAVVASAVVARAQARLVLTIAAAYGFDPAAEDRVREVLTLLRVPRLSEPTRASLAHLARMVTSIAARRAAARVVPFGSAVAAAIQAGRGTADVAQRAIERYGRLSGPARYR